MMKHYVKPNMSAKSQTTVKYFLKVLSSICESIVFMYLGIVAMVNIHQLDFTFIVGTLAACLISRVIGKCFICFIISSTLLMIKYFNIVFLDGTD